MGNGLLDSAGGSNRCGSNDLGEADRMLLLACAAWPVPVCFDRVEGVETDPEPFGSPLWTRLEPSWGRRLRAAACTGNPTSIGTDPVAAASAWEQLRDKHRAAARVDLGRVHPSWWVRALREESPAVQRVVVASAPDPVRHPLQAGLWLDTQDLAGDRAADPTVRAWVLSLWAERLVGGEPERPDDPPAIRALSCLSLRAGYRLCRGAGLAKLDLAGSDQESGHAEETTPLGPARKRWTPDRGPAADPELRALAARDVQDTPLSKWPRRRRAARLGLLTIARLLADCEPFRVRWAIQHWPYAIAKLTRSLMPPPTGRSPNVGRFESMVLKSAWNRLNLEGRFSAPWPGPDDRPRGAT